MLAADILFDQSISFPARRPADNSSLSAAGGSPVISAGIYKQLIAKTFWLPRHVFI
jgi:hypothetical protein